MAWTLAPCLDTLFDQLNAAFPRRARKSDGTKGDKAHAARASDHNPDRDDRSVNAGDITHGPAYGKPDVDCDRLARELVASGDRRIDYLIFKRRIWMAGVGWASYGGSNPHDKHLHISVRHESRYEDDRSPWRLPMLGYATAQTPVPVTPSRPAQPAATTPRHLEDDEMPRLIQHDKQPLWMFLRGQKRWPVRDANEHAIALWEVESQGGGQEVVNDRYWKHLERTTDLAS